MQHISTDINKLTRIAIGNPDFPDAPLDWTRDDAMQLAHKEKLELTEEHWDAIRALQHYYAHHDEADTINLRELHDALDEHFHAKGGLKYLYTRFPGGPVAQCCRLAGLKPPPIATDPGFGSVA